jgi:hypothetical protein
MLIRIGVTTCNGSPCKNASRTATRLGQFASDEPLKHYCHGEANDNQANNDCKHNIYNDIVGYTSHGVT